MPNTVILGHYYYGNLLFCCDEYLTHRAPEQRYPLWPGHGSLPALSWLDYFILGDVYSLGFGFDTSEMDLWWLLCRKKGSGPPRGPVVFEPERQSAETKRALLEAYHAKCVSLGFREPGAGTIGPFMKRQSRRLDGGSRRKEEPARGSRRTGPPEEGGDGNEKKSTMAG